MPPSQEFTTIVSLAGGALIASLPKLVDLLLGGTMASRQERAKAEEEYRRATFADAATFRAEQAQLREELRARVRELEARVRELEGELDDTRSGVPRKEPDPK